MASVAELRASIAAAQQNFHVALMILESITEDVAEQAAMLRGRAEAIESGEYNLIGMVSRGQEAIGDAGEAAAAVMEGNEEVAAQMYGACTSARETLTEVGGDLQSIKEAIEVLVAGMQATSEKPRDAINAIQGANEALDAYASTL